MDDGLDNWQDGRGGHSSSRGRRLGILAAALAVVAAVGVLAFIAVVVVGRAADTAESFLPEHAVDERLSPDSRWALVVDSATNTLDDDTTTVYLEARPDASAAPSVRIHRGDWSNGSDARWRDARTISIAGALQMPFVEHEIDTGSAGTTGTDVDVEGYVHNRIAPGERVLMLSGLSMVLPGGREGSLLTQRRGLAGRERQALLEAIDPPATSFGPYALAALKGPDEFSSWKVLKKDGQLIGKSRRVQVWWAPTSQWIVVVTELPHRMIGLLWKQHARAANATAARRETQRMWQRFSVQGADLPWAARE